MSDETRQLTREVYEHLGATADRPIRPDANRWLGEAEAVVADVADAEVSDDVLAERMAHVSELLAHVESTGDDRADEHVTVAKELADDVCRRLAG